MAAHPVKLPDVGEGVAEAELVQWLVAIGDAVRADTPVAEVMTDKATVELYAGVAGTVAARHGEPGDSIAVGSELMSIETDGSVVVAPDAPQPAASPATPAPVATANPFDRPDVPDGTTASAPPPPDRPKAAPAVRKLARDRGVDLSKVRGSGPDGRILRSDIDAHIGAVEPRVGGRQDGTHETPIIGLRRRIAAQMSTAASRIPHITYVEEVDVTALESLRTALQHDSGEELPPLTPLPFIVRAVVRALRHHPELNSTFDDERGVLVTHDAVHVGIATQTPGGLIVPVVHHADSMDLWQLSESIRRGADAARDGSAPASDLSGSTVTVTSLGALGGIMSTPIINQPEVAIVGINRIRTQPMWNGDTFVPRQVMNLSSSFDHRIVDGWVAATFVQRIKTSLESPALLFIDEPRIDEPSIEGTGGEA